MESSDNRPQSSNTRRRAHTQRSWIFGGLFIAGLVVFALMLRTPDPASEIRGQITEGLKLTEGAQTAVAAFIAEHQAYPQNNAAAGLGSPESISSTYVSSVSVDNGWIVVRFGNGAHRRIQGKTLTLIPDVVEGKGVAWGCSAGEIEVGDLPARCR